MPNATTRDHRNTGSEKLLPPEMVKQVRLLQRNVNEYEAYLDALRYNLGEMQNALREVQEVAQCLLTDEPFEVWDVKRRKKGGAEPDAQHQQTEDDFRKLITPEMRQEALRVKRLLDQYAESLREFLSEIENKKAYDRALSSAGKLATHPFEYWKAKKQREGEAATAHERADHEIAEGPNEFGGTGEERHEFDHLD